MLYEGKYCMSELEIDKIRKLLAIAKTPKEKAMYQQILNRLGATTPTPPKPPEPPKQALPKPGAKVSIKPRPNKPIVQVTPKVESPGLEPQVNPIFQAVGVLQGEVRFGERGKGVIKVGGVEYPLFSIPNKRRKKAFNLLREEVERTGNPNQRVIVYPNTVHFPSRDEPHRMSFILVGFVKEGEHKPGIENHLKDFEFILRGLWQFIPVCRTPCITVYKNFTDARLDWVKGVEPYRQVQYMKGSHLPLLWRDAPTKPFRFNPNEGKEQGTKPYFVAVKARFIPERNLFAFVEELGQPLEKPPRFLKASKELKATAIKTKPVYTPKPLLSDNAGCDVLSVNPLLD